MDKEVLFTVKWKKGNQCINDLKIDYCKKNNIDFRYNNQFQLEINYKGEWIKTDYICNGDIVTIVKKNKINIKKAGF